MRKETVKSQIPSFTSNLNRVDLSFSLFIREREEKNQMTQSMKGIFLFFKKKDEQLTIGKQCQVAINGT